MRINKGGRLQGAWHVAHIEEKYIKGISQGNLRERNHLENLYINWWIIFKWTLKKQDGRVWTGFIWLMIGTRGRGVGAFLTWQ
jgi:hypothetical protein